MTSYPISLPDNEFNETIAITMEFAVSLSESPFNFASQTYDWGGARWRMDFNPPLLKREDAEEWIAFGLSLRGQKGTFLMGDPSAKNPRGIGGGTPLVNGGSQTGGTLIIDGCPVSTTGWLKKGDYFQLGSGATACLYKLISDANTNGSGQVTLDFVPNLRTIPADNAALTIVDAKGVFRMSSNQVSWTGEARDKIYHYSFSAVEAL